MTTDRFVIRGKRHAGTIAARSDRIVVGSGSACTLTIDDPLVADGHASIRFTGGGFEIEDLDTSAGTYINGIAVHHPTSLAHGDTIVLGLSKLHVEIDGEALQLKLLLKEKGFHFDKKIDPLAWARAETSFGRFRALRWGNWFAAGGLIALFGMFFLTPLGDQAAEPGPLVGAHAEALASHERAEGCASCHAPFGGTPKDRCIACHEDFVAATHPFGKWEGQECVPCHIDHRGVANRSTVARLAAETCGDCHPADRVVAERETSVSPPPTRQVAILYNAFSHADHVSKEKIACDRCHRRETEDRTAAIPASASAGGAGAGGAASASKAEIPAKEFAVVSHEVCMSCHARDAPPAERAKTTYVSTWHGTDGDGDHCLRCHQSLHDRTLRQVTSRSVTREFAFLSRSHHAQLLEAEEASAAACERCHRRGTVGGGRTIRSIFRHGTHMSSLFPDENSLATERSADCAACHVDDAAAPRLSSDVYRGPAAKSCERCHVEANGEKRVPTWVDVPSGSDAASGETQRIDFPHDAHRDTSHPRLARGCFTCHEFGDGESWSAKPSTIASAKTCRPCHDAHDSIGGGDCDACHVTSDPVYTGQHPTREWPRNSNFSHFSFGHAEIIESRGQAGCLECHGGAEGAQTIADVPIPSEADRLCRDCHVSRKTRFHWR